MPPRTTSNVAVIRNTALKLFSEGGYTGTSMRDIAATAGVSTANIYNYAESKEELLWNLIRESTDMLTGVAQRVLAGRVCPVDRLSVLVGAHVEFHVRNPWRARVLAQQVQHLSAVHRRVAKASQAEYQEHFASAIEEGVELRMFRTEHGRLATPAILWMGIGTNRWFVRGGPDTAQSVSRVLTEFALGLLAYDESAHEKGCPQPGAGHSQQPGPG
ncbi:TetR/AcrR family transcriptional regulator [Pseudonocardia halophobica]|uniref:TetR/AcrR family transcriptional regulator n=1 Tax=Pseudonocardia halophobica TaxID=29401 RepID=UPI003D8A9FE2